MSARDDHTRKRIAFLVKNVEALRKTEEKLAPAIGARTKTAPKAVFAIRRKDSEAFPFPAPPKDAQQRNTTIC